MKKNGDLIYQKMFDIRAATKDYVQYFMDQSADHILSPFIDCTHKNSFVEPFRCLILTLCSFIVFTVQGDPHESAGASSLNSSTVSSLYNPLIILPPSSPKETNYDERLSSTSEGLMIRSVNHQQLSL